MHKAHHVELVAAAVRRVVCKRGRLLGRWQVGQQVPCKAANLAAHQRGEVCSLIHLHHCSTLTRAVAALPSSAGGAWQQTNKGILDSQAVGALEQGCEPHLPSSSRYMTVWMHDT